MSGLTPGKGTEVQGAVSCRAKRAASYFAEGYNCAQASAASFAEDLGVDVEWILRAAAGFGAGMGGLRETCGAVSAMALVAGMKFGGYAPNDLSAKKACYRKVRAMHAEFAARHGSTCCRELLARASIEPQSEPSERTAEYHATRPCVRLVASAAEILEQILRNA